MKEKFKKLSKKNLVPILGQVKALISAGLVKAQEILLN